MPKAIKVIYENGVFKPLEKVELKDKTKARVIIESISDRTFGILKISEEELDRALEELDEEWGFY